MIKIESPEPACAFCAAPLRTEMINEEIDYATPSGNVKLPVKMPYEICDNCGYRGFGEAGEKARTDAIYRFQKRLPPSEIVSIRTSLGLSQASYAEVLGVGRASLERWELGTTMQNQSMDNLILCLSTQRQIKSLQAEKFDRLKALTSQDKVVDISQFQCLTGSEEEELREKGKSFVLRGRG